MSCHPVTLAAADRSRTVPIRPAEPSDLKYARRAALLFGWRWPSGALFGARAGPLGGNHGQHRLPSAVLCVFRPAQAASVLAPARSDPDLRTGDGHRSRDVGDDHDLGLGRTRAYELVMARKIQSVKVGRRRLVVRSSLLDFVQALLVGQDCA